jgi:putative ABC transport system substrate-binding protein
MMMNRRLVLRGLALALGALPIATGAQTADKIYRVGFLTITSGPASTAVVDGLTHGLAERGYVVGRNLVIETRSADAKANRLRGLAKELVDSRVDVLVTFSYPAARAAKEATTTIPIVVTTGGDPVETGLVVSLNRPGGNITGVSDVAAELSAKRLELLKAATSDLKRVAMLWNADDLGMTTRYRAAAAAASVLGIDVQPLGVREPDDFDAAFATMDLEKPGGILMVTDVLTMLNRKRVFDFAASRRVPAIYEFDSLVRDGGLMSYGPDRKEVNARFADLVGRVLKGDKPADLPFEQPTHFLFVINRKTADTIGLTLPDAVLDRADEVIE